MHFFLHESKLIVYIHTSLLLCSLPICLWWCIAVFKPPTDQEILCNHCKKCAFASICGGTVQTKQGPAYKRGPKLHRVP